MTSLEELTPIEQEAMQVAIAQAEKSRDEGGVPIGSSIILDNAIVGEGHNQRIQKRSQILHAEMAALEDAGDWNYRGATMVTTLYPCPVCAMTAAFYGFSKVIVGERETFWDARSAAILAYHNIEVVVLDLAECKALMNEFINRHPKIWRRDIGE